jgi:HlyD family secretion protein
VALRSRRSCNGYLSCSKAWNNSFATLRFALRDSAGGGRLRGDEAAPKVSQVRQSPQTVQNVVTFDVVVGVDNSDLDLKPGMTAATRIILDQRSNVVRAPSQALRYVPSGVTTGPAGSSAVGGGPQGQIWILHEGRAVAIPVEIGIDDESVVEIAAGNVKPGDQVIVAEQRQASGRAVPLPRL